MSRNTFARTSMRNLTSQHLPKSLTYRFPISRAHLSSPEVIHRMGKSNETDVVRLSVVPDEEMDDGHANAPCIRESSRQLGASEKEQAVEIGRIARLEGKDRRRDGLPDRFTINRKAGRNPDQRADNNIARIVDAEIDPRQRRERGKDTEQHAPPPRYQPEAGADRKQVRGIVAREAAPVLEVGVPFEGRRIGSNAVH